MSCFKKMEYEMIPEHSFNVLRPGIWKSALNPPNLTKLRKPDGKSEVSRTNSP